MLQEPVLGLQLELTACPQGGALHALLTLHPGHPGQLQDTVIVSHLQSIAALRFAATSALARFPLDDFSVGANSEAPESGGGEAPKVQELN